ncbi:MAG: CocE/NonD family hydrolase, partial [Acidobacteriota bacterium]|nr:CocE/NonD family hydrolase [Acidobacteriota bacterium]
MPDSRQLRFRKKLAAVPALLFLLACLFSLCADPLVRAQTMSPFPEYKVEPQYKEVTVQSLYLPMRDGVRIAVDVVLPKELPQGARIPAIMIMTRYWRATEGKGINGTKRFFALHGYAVVTVDVRGSGASFGVWMGPQSSDEIKDSGEVVNWIVSQPWSNGAVGAIGVSYEGSTAQMLAVPNNPAVKAVVPQFHEFDLYTDIAFPGGIADDWFVRTWNEANQAADMSTAVKRVDADTDGHLLREAIKDHANNLDVYKAVTASVYRDDRPAGFSQSVDDLSVFRYRKEIESSKVAIYGWGSWMDAATADTCIRRFLNFSNPETEIIGPWSHGASYDANPFLPADAPVAPSRREQLTESLRFFDYYLKGKPSGAKVMKSMVYYTMGEEKWKTTTVWPLRGTTMQRWYMRGGGSLSTAAPKESTGEDRYTVDFEATTGKHNRWFTENGGSDVVYPDRAEEDKRLLTYTSAPLVEDMEVTGYPVVNLFVTSTAADGAFYVYLEDVDEKGRVTYVTEGELRALHRKVSKEAQPFKTLVPYHSFKRKDGAPLV